jgi:hypothetical protein
LSLANFGSVTFTSATATINGKTGAIDNSTWQATSINMASGSTLEASTSALTDSSAASSFTVTYKSSLSSASSNGTKVGQHVSSPRLANGAAVTTIIASYDFLQPAAKNHLDVSAKDEFFAVFGLFCR